MLGIAERAHPVRIVLVGIAAAVIVRETLNQSQGPDTTAQLSALAACIAVLCAAVFFYLDWHIGLDRSMAWLVTAVSAFALQEVTWLAALLGDSDPGGSTGAWTAPFQVLVCLGLCLLVTQSHRLRVRYDPLALGLTIGLAISLARYAIVEAPLPEPSLATFAVMTCALGLTGLWNAIALLRTPALTSGLRLRTAMASILLGIGQTAAFAAQTPSWLAVTSIFANVAGATILLATAASRARSAVCDEVDAVGVLRRRVESAEVDLHTHQASRHEVRTTLAGLTSAAHLLHRSGLGLERRRQLEEMMAEELARLARLVGHASAPSVEPTELDATLRRLVVRHEATGARVQWRPSGHVAAARADDVAEIVGVLLANAARHAPGSDVAIDVNLVGPRIEITVSDSGPGVDPRLAAHLFEWGARGSQSPGEGIGLAAARALAEDMGGHLRLAADPAAGATFVLELATVSASEPQDVEL